MIKSGLLNLTALSKNDINLYLGLYTDPETMALVDDPLTEASATALFNKTILESTKDAPKYLFYVIRKNSNNNKVGIVGLLWNQTERNSVEMGVMVSKPYHRKGYAIKALNLLMQYVFHHMDITSIVAFCNENNPMANRVSKGLGYKNMGLFIDPKSNQRKIKWEITIEQYKQSRKR